jgi:hypothetical protein
MEFKTCYAYLAHAGELASAIHLGSNASRSVKEWHVRVPGLVSSHIVWLSLRCDDGGKLSVAAMAELQALLWVCSKRPIDDDELVSLVRRIRALRSAGERIGTYTALFVI